MSIFLTNPKFKKKAFEIFTKVKLPGESPVAKMIKGQNRELLMSQFRKNFGFLKHQNKTP